MPPGQGGIQFCGLARGFISDPRGPFWLRGRRNLCSVVAV
jgi:hypothetical protein